MKNHLVENLFALGVTGIKHANESWMKLGLDINKGTEIGLSLQGILDRVDNMVEKADVKVLEVGISVSNEKCALKIKDSSFSDAVYSANVA